MKREDLKAQGLTDEQIEMVMAAHGKDVSKNQSDLAAAQAEAATLKSQLTEAGAAIESFKAMKPDELKAAADEYKSKYEQAQADAQKQVASLKFDYALDGALVGAKAKNSKAVKALLDASVLKMNDDGSILGLKEQLEKVKSENDYLFDSETPLPRIVTRGNSQSVLGDKTVEAARAAAGLPVQGK